MMRLAPVPWRPAIEKLFLWTRDEVINQNNPDWIEKLKEKEQQKIKDQDEEETKRWNERVLKEFPAAPAWLLRQPKEEGPAPLLPSPPPIAPSHPEYICMKTQERILRRWNREYLEYRLESRWSPEKCAYEVLKREMDKGMLDGTDEENSQMKSIWTRFYLYVPSTDHLDLSKRVDRDKVREALSSFDYDPSSCEEIRTLQQMTLDEFGYPQIQTFMKLPHAKMDYQIAEMDALNATFMDGINKNFDVMYDDDFYVELMMAKMSEEEKEVMRRVLSIQPGIAEEGARTKNPRRRALDSHFYEENRIGFIGPSHSATAPLEPGHREIVIKQRQYAMANEEQWAAMEEAADRITEARQLRHTYKGRL
ncbi:hypothetical protein PMAYCL1PPCAC_05973 [Pristionchus mayeri]|uniref:Uncharacterized protein n=1 Tax=Pristionchus mayeri TaxID=1317129 RepID=A0AAN5C3J0_9BILA|nr:hypothetical protein PMAYCL1PPCAC_05973 [Pristionchus mayeri]